MNDRQENYLSMCVATKTTLDNHNATWAATPAFVTQNTDFNLKLSTLQSLKTGQETDITGYAVDKAGKKQDMIDKTMGIIGGLKAYALAENNNVLLEEINYSESDLKQTRDELVASKCQIVQDRAITYSADLLNYNIADGMIAEQQTAIGDYSASSQLPSTKEDARQVITSQIDGTISEIRGVLEIIDSLVKTFEATQPAFVEEYFNSREIYDLGRGGGGGEPPSA